MKSSSTTDSIHIDDDNGSDDEYESEEEWNDEYWMDDVIEVNKLERKRGDNRMIVVNHIHDDKVKYLRFIKNDSRWSSQSLHSSTSIDYSTHQMNIGRNSIPLPV